jgi:hypothetical protein
MADVNLLKLAYGANIIILVPVVYAMLIGNGVASAFEGRVDESAGLRLMVASFWFAILASSVAGLAWPKFFAPILIVQIIYKALWLAIFVWPLMQRSGWEAIPTGIVGVFAAIVVTYPLILFFALREP